MTNESQNNQTTLKTWQRIEPKIYSMTTLKVISGKIIIKTATNNGRLIGPDSRHSSVTLFEGETPVIIAYETSVLQWSGYHTGKLLAENNMNDVIPTEEIDPDVCS